MARAFRVRTEIQNEALVQTTIKSAVTFHGVGLHTGRNVSLTIHPASAEYGIWFRRTDIEVGDTLIPARWDSVTPSRLCTTIENPSGASISTIEHVMAALAGCGIHNALIEVSGPEVPILDGSATQFVRGILARGIRTLDAPVRIIEILQPVEVREGNAIARLETSDAFEIDFRIDFADGAIGKQSMHLNMANGTFVRELCASRTFCRQSDVDTMRANGLARGGTLNNAIVVDGDVVLSPGGMRYKDEAVRHKMLDALGDLALAGAPIVGRYVGDRAGHALTNKLLRALFLNPAAFRMVECDTKTAGRLPGVGVHPADIPAVA
jgi:UDP-3-O-[3-hydroxymyristoyl] N-acetylglucosamine deacetylase